MSTQHTPGPYRAEGTIVRVADCGQFLAYCSQPHLADAQAGANACLFAAAPELLAALRETLTAFRQCIGNAAFNDFAASGPVANAIAAIAKAEGQS